ncbi:hypothetical protein KAU33_11600 [Candidatus Dependentiae bacterium]|nr:hypothetical protein [Candidatus Dependentiae bacterium]
MKIYWSLKSIPELKSFPEKERKRIWKESYSKSFKQRKTWVAIILSWLVLAFVYIILSYFIAEYFFWNLWISWISWLVLCGIWAPFYTIIIQRLTIPIIREKFNKKSEDKDNFGVKN